MKLIVAGSRSANGPFTRGLIYGLLDQYRKRYPDLIIVSGAARMGADRFAIEYCDDRGCKDILKKFPADWDNLGKSAGFIRNVEMAEYADELLLIWDGESNGSKHMTESMVKRGKYIRTIIVEKELDYEPKPQSRGGSATGVCGEDYTW